MKTLITLTNNFHNTSIKIRAFTLEKAEYFYAANNGKLTTSARRIQKALCGVEGCTCGDWLGRR